MPQKRLNLADAWSNLLPVSIQSSLLLFQPYKLPFLPTRHFSATGLLHYLHLQSTLSTKPALLKPNQSLTSFTKATPTCASKHSNNFSRDSQLSASPYCDKSHDGICDKPASTRKEGTVLPNVLHGTCGDSHKEQNKVNNSCMPGASQQP